MWCFDLHNFPEALFSILKITHAPYLPLFFRVPSTNLLSISELALGLLIAPVSVKESWGIWVDNSTPNTKMHKKSIMMGILFVCCVSTMSFPQDIGTCFIFKHYHCLNITVCIFQKVLYMSNGNHVVGSIINGCSTLQMGLNGNITA